MSAGPGWWSGLIHPVTGDRLARLLNSKRMHRDHLQMLIGGTVAAAVLLLVSTAMTQRPNTPYYAPYKLFYEHTIETHDSTPLTNHMGLRVIIGHKFLEITKPAVMMGEDELAKAKAAHEADPFNNPPPQKFGIGIAKGKSSGQMQFTRNNKELDPFKTLLEDLELYVEAWKEWIELPNPEEEELPGDWPKKCTPFAKLLLLRAVRLCPRRRHGRRLFVSSDNMF